MVAEHTIPTSNKRQRTANQDRGWRKDWALSWVSTGVGTLSLIAGLLSVVPGLMHRLETLVADVPKSVLDVALPA